MISKTIQLWSAKVLHKAYQDTKEIFRNLASDVTVGKENLDLREARQIIYHLKSNVKSFPKM